jgi:Anti-sigma-28 factor, FlgM
MNGNQEKASRIKQLLETGQYRVDPRATADAIVLRMRAIHAAAPRPAARPQVECSYPRRFLVVSRNATSPGPATTEPIRVRAAFAGSEL